MRAISIKIKIMAKEVKDMAKYLNLWRHSPTAPWPTDPVEAAKVLEMLFAGVENLIKTGEVKEFGYFLDGTSGYIIMEGESKDMFRCSVSFSTFIEFELQEIVPYETGKEIARGVLKAQAEAVKK